MKEKIFVIVMFVMLIVIFILISNSGVEISFDDTYILNTDGYVVAELKELDEGFELYLRGIRGYKSICARYKCKLNGNKGFNEDETIEINFENSNIVLVSKDDEHKVIEGTYVIDSEITQEIISTEEKDFDGLYTNGIMFGGLHIDISEVNQEEYQVVLTGMMENNIFVDFAIAKKIDENILYIEDISTSYIDANTTAKIELVENGIIFNIEDDGGIEHYNSLNGTYKCMFLDIEFCKNYDYSSLGDGVYGKIIQNIRPKHTKTENGIHTEHNF